MRWRTSRRAITVFVSQKYMSYKDLMQTREVGCARFRDGRNRHGPARRTWFSARKSSRCSASRLRKASITSPRSTPRYAGSSLGIGRTCYRSCRRRKTDRAAGSRNNRRDHKKERIVGYGARLPGIDVHVKVPKGLSHLAWHHGAARHWSDGCGASRRIDMRRVGGGMALKGGQGAQV